MKAYLDCLVCFARQALQAARLCTDSEALQRKCLQAAFAYLAEVPEGPTPPDLGWEVHRLVQKLTDCGDPYAELKRLSNRQALDLLPKVKEVLAKADDPLQAALQAAIAGNIIDFGPDHEIDLEATLQSALATPLDSRQLEYFKQAIEAAEKILYVADNAGELVFDTLLLEQFAGKQVTVAVKAVPFLNDAQLDDAEQAGLTRPPFSDFIRLVEVRPRLTGTTLGEASPEFSAAWQDADLIICKGQANYEWYSLEPGPTFFLLKVKCDVIGYDIGFPTGTSVLVRGEDLPRRKLASAKA